MRRIRLQKLLKTDTREFRGLYVYHLVHAMRRLRPLTIQLPMDSPR